VKGFDKLSPNGAHLPFALSLSKGRCRRVKGFDKLSPNGDAGLSPNGVGGLSPSEVPVSCAACSRC